MVQGLSFVNSDCQPASIELMSVNFKTLYGAGMFYLQREGILLALLKSLNHHKSDDLLNPAFRSLVRVTGRRGSFLCG